MGTTSFPHRVESESEPRRQLRIAMSIMPQKSQDDDDVLTFSHGTSKGLSTALQGCATFGSGFSSAHHEAL